MNRTYKLLAVLVLVVALWALTGCGGGAAPGPTPTAAQPPRPLQTAEVVVIGGSELFDGPQVRHNFGPCATNEGVEGGDSVAMLGLFSLGIMNDYPGSVILVANGLELTYAERSTTLDNFAAMVNLVQVEGSRATIVGVPGANGFNAELKALAASRGAVYASTIDAEVCK